MIDSDKAEFSEMTKGLFNQSNYTPPDKQTLREWWGALSTYTVKDVLKAYDTVIDLQAKPTIDNVKMWLKQPEKIVDKGTEPYPLRIPDDGRNWARKILNNPKGKEQVAVKLSKQALHINE